VLSGRNVGGGAGVVLLPLLFEDGRPMHSLASYFDASLVSAASAPASWVTFHLQIQKCFWCCQIFCSTLCLWFFPPLPWTCWCLGFGRSICCGRIRVSFHCRRWGPTTRCSGAVFSGSWLDAQHFLELGGDVLWHPCVGEFSTLCHCLVDSSTNVRGLGHAPWMCAPIINTPFARFMKCLVSSCTPLLQS
jgi:hypothetical protein